MADGENWYTVDPKQARCKHGWVKGPGCEACKAEPPTEPRIFITVQRVVGGREVCSRKEISFLHLVQARSPGGLAERAIKTALAEVGVRL